MLAETQSWAPVAVRSAHFSSPTVWQSPAERYCKSRRCRNTRRHPGGGQGEAGNGSEQLPWRGGNALAVEHMAGIVDNRLQGVGGQGLERSAEAQFGQKLLHVLHATGKGTARLGPWGSGVQDVVVLLEGMATA